jgi:hypothetical protein
MASAIPKPGISGLVPKDEHQTDDYGEWRDLRDILGESQVRQWEGLTILLGRLKSELIWELIKTTTAASTAWRVTGKRIAMIIG